MDRIHRDRSFPCDVFHVCLEKRLGGTHKCRPDSGNDECCICLEVKYLYLWREQTYSWSHVLKQYFCYVLCFHLLFIDFFLLNLFLLLKEIVILKMYLLVHPLTPKGFEKISINWIFFFFTLFIGCLQWLSNSTMLYKVHKDCAVVMIKKGV